MVWTCASLLFSKRKRLNDQSYHNQLLPFYREEDEGPFGHKNWDFQQDGGRSHAADKVQKWCNKNFKSFIPKEKWPQNSYELNSLDYSIWDNISNHVEYHIVKVINGLRREVEKAIKLTLVMYRKGLVCFPSTSIFSGKT